MNGGVDSQWKKTQSVFFTNKRIDERLIIRMYGKEIERVGTFTFLGVHFDSRLTWAEHIRRVEEKSKKVIHNEMLNRKRVGCTLPIIENNLCSLD